eukprot:8745395-Pyramimonas_sp.AAC.1
MRMKERGQGKGKGKGEGGGGEDGLVRPAVATQMNQGQSSGSEPSSVPGTTGRSLSSNLSARGPRVRKYARAALLSSKSAPPSWA